MTETTTRIAPVYELIQEEPPAATRATRPNKLAITLEGLFETPNTWFRVASYKNKAGASAVKTQIKKGGRKIPMGDFEFKAVSDEEGSKLYARLVDED